MAYAQMLLHGTASSSSTTRAQQLQLYSGMQFRVAGSAPSAGASSSTSASAASTSSMQLDSSAPPLVRGVSEDSANIPLGLALLIEAMPGKNQGATSDIAGQGEAGAMSKQIHQADAQQAAPTGSNVGGKLIGLPPPRALQRSTSY
jgi:hypothetical protein